MIRILYVWLTLFVSGSMAAAAEKRIDFYVGHTNGGLAATFSTVMSQALEQKGWQINYKVIGNCGQVKNLMMTSDRPTLATWGANWNLPTNVCNMEMLEQNFIDILLDSPRLLCGPVDAPDFQLQRGKSYRVGVNPGQHHDIMLRDLSAKTGIDFRAIEYKNSGYIEKAMRGREIDLWYTNKGLVEHHEGKQKCFYGTFNENSNGIIALNKLIEGDQAYASFMAYLFVNELFTDDLKKLLVQDVRTIIESANYQALLSQGGNVSPKGTKQEKINMVKRNARSYAKPHAAK